MSDSITSATFQMTREMVHQWGWFLAFGIVLAILGLAAMIRSFSSTVASMLFIGWLLIFRRSDRVHRIVHGWALGRVLPAPARGGSLAIYRHSFHQQTTDQC